jgi:N-acetylglutamate synthase-like GNAT family acetyltransferase
MDGGSGRCLCGDVRFSFEGPPNWQAHCHCESCRRNCAAPFTSYLGVSHGRWSWIASVPAVYSSSPGVRRHFCPRCGTPMAFEGAPWPHEIHFYAATLDDPSAYRPGLHVNWNEHLPWIKLADGLPVHRTPRRLTGDEDMAPILKLIRECFAYMDGRIDPPSSMHALTETGVAEQARTGEAWVLEEPGVPVACVFLTPKSDRLYIGKLAVADAFRGQGLGRQLIDHAANRAKALGLATLELQTRVELVENQTAFEAMGFVRTGETAHPGYDRPTSITYSRPI